MIYYLVAATIPLLIGWWRNFYFNNYGVVEMKKAKAEKWFVFFAILPIFLLYVLRGDHVGVDTIGYVRNFQEIDGNLVEAWTDAVKDPGFFAYTRLISMISGDYTVYFLITGLIIFIPIYFFAIKHTQNPYVFIFLVIALGYYSFIETGMRQAMAMSICLTAYGTLKNKTFPNVLRFLLTCFIAYFFHKSSVIFLMFFFVSFFKDNMISYAIYFLLTVMFVFGFAFLQDLFNEWVGYSYEVEETGNGEIFLLLIIALYIANLILGSRAADKKEHTILFNSANLTVIMWVLRLISRTAERISLYFTLGFYGHIIGIFALNRESRELKIWRFLIIFVCLLLFIYRNRSMSYTFFWSA